MRWIVQLSPVALQRDKILLGKIVLRLKSLRNEKGVSQEKVLLDTGVHIGRIESEKVNVSIDTLKRLCNYFEISLSEFFSKIKE